jgi:hypothetical protein
MGLLIAFFVIVALLAFLGLANNKRLGGSLQTKYDGTMDSLQEKQDDWVRARDLMPKEERERRGKERIAIAFLVIVALVGLSRACGF